MMQEMENVDESNQEELESAISNYTYWNTLYVWSGMMIVLGLFPVTLAFISIFAGSVQLGLNLFVIAYFVGFYLFRRLSSKMMFDRYAVSFELSSETLEFFDGMNIGEFERARQFIADLVGDFVPDYDVSVYLGVKDTKVEVMYVRRKDTKGNE